MNCLNLSNPDFNRLAKDFGEVAISNIMDICFPLTTPTYDEFISDKEVKDSLGIIPMSKVIDHLGVSYKKIISDKQLTFLKKRVSSVNNFNYSQNNKVVYKLFNIKQQGQSDNFTWGLRKISGELNMDAKIERAESRVVDAKQNQTPVAKLKELEQIKLEFPEVANTIDELIKQCK